MKSFADLIAPVSFDDFLANHWEKTFLHVQHEPGRLSNLFSLQDVDRWLTSTSGMLSITAPEGSDVPTQTYRPQDISMSLVYAAFAKGCSLIFDALEDWPALQGLAKALGGEFHAKIGIEAFLTPPGTRTLPAFAAGHDLLFLHLEGEKIWQLREFSLLQFHPVQKKNLKFPLEWYGRTKTPVVAEVCAKPGDVLFIPRGMPHQAVAQNGNGLHLSISITTLCWVDFLKTAAEAVALHSQELRRSLPPGFVRSQEACERMRSTFEDVMRAFQEQISFDEALAAVKRNRITLQNFPADGHFTQLAELKALTADSEVERRPDVLCSVDEVPDINRIPKSVLFFGKEQVSGPRGLRRAMEFIRDHPRFRVSELPGLDEQGQLVLVRRLITEGLLRQVLAAKRVEQPEPAAP